MNETINAGFTYTVEVVSADGTVTDSEVVHNLMPVQGINHTLGVLLKGESQVSTWYIGLYEGNYTPTSSDVMSTFPVAATETVAYTASTRLTFTSGTITAGGVDNSSNKAEFTFNATKTIYGGFISSASAKSSTSGTLLSVVKFGSPKSLDSGSVLRVTAGFTMASA